MEPGKVKLASETSAIKAMKKALKPLRLLNWTVGEPDPNDPENLEKLKMAGIQRQKSIPDNFADALDSLIRTASEVQEEDRDLEYEFKVSDSVGIPVCHQRIKLTRKILDDIDAAIDAGSI